MLFAIYQIAEQCGVTVRRLRQEIDLPEMVYWQGYRRYKAALESQARERGKMEADAERKARQERGHQMRKR